MANFGNGTLFMGVATRDDLAGATSGVDLLRQIHQHAPGMAPTRCGHWEPLRTQIQYGDLAASVHTWDDYPMFFWKRRRPLFEGSSTRRVDPRVAHGHIAIHGPASGASQDSLLSLVVAFCNRFDADFASIQVGSRAEAARARGNATLLPLNPGGGPEYLLSVPPLLLRRYIPDIYWVTVLGPSYVRFFGRGKLLSVPCFAATELDGGSVLLQLSESMTDCTEDTLRLESVRDEVRRFLDSDAIYDLFRGPSYAYKVPSFETS